MQVRLRAGDDMAEVKNIDGHYYPPFHSGWGGFAEELFHYTSRYYLATEAFVRNLAGDRVFSMAAYKAQSLRQAQREVLAVVLSGNPDRQRGEAVVSIVQAVQRGDEGVAPDIAARFPPLPAREGRIGGVEHHLPTPGLKPGMTPDVDPLDPFLNMAERLLMPVAVRDRHVAVSMHEFARHLDSVNSTVRENLQDAVIEMHEAGYVLRNHPCLTHSQAAALSDDSPEGD